MKKLKLIISLFFIAFSANVFSNEVKEEHISNNQRKIIMEVLAKYDSSSLDAKGAKAIHEEFRLAEIRINPEMERFMEGIGFDSQKLKELAPRPEVKENAKAERKEEKKGEEKDSHRDEANIKYVENSMNSKGEFHVESSALNENGFLSLDYSGDGKGISMPLEWSKIPEGTKYFALNLWHLPNSKDYADVKSYWLLYDIPADITALPEGVEGIGKVGYNDKDFMGYDPMKSKSPGVKEYNLTVYALSAKPELASQKVTRLDLLKAIEELIIEECTVTYKYERDEK